MRMVVIGQEVWRAGFGAATTLKIGGAALNEREEVDKNVGSPMQSTR